MEYYYHRYYHHYRLFRVAGREITRGISESLWVETR